MGQLRRTPSSMALRMEEAKRKSQESSPTPMLELPPTVTPTPTTASNIGLKVSLSSPNLQTTVSQSSTQSMHKSPSTVSINKSSSVFSPLKLWAEKFRTTQQPTTKKHLSIGPSKNVVSTTPSPRTTPRGPKITNPLVRESPRLRSMITKGRSDSEASLASLATATGESNSSLACLSSSPLLLPVTVSQHPHQNSADELSSLPRLETSLSVKKSKNISPKGDDVIVEDGIEDEGSAKEASKSVEKSDVESVDVKEKVEEEAAKPVKLKGIIKPYQPLRQTRFGFSYNKKCDGGAVRKTSVNCENTSSSSQPDNKISSKKNVSFGNELYTTVYHYEQVDVPKHMAPWLNTKGLKEFLFGKGKAPHPLVVANSAAHQQQSSSDEESKTPQVVEYSEKVMIPLPQLESFMLNEDGNERTLAESKLRDKKEPRNGHQYSVDRASSEGLSLDELKASFDKQTRSGSADAHHRTPLNRSSSFSPTSSTTPRTPVKSNSARPSSRGRTANGKKVRMPPENFSFMAHRMM